MQTTGEPAAVHPDRARSRRKWRAVLILGIVLCCGPAVGIMMTIASMLYSVHQIDAQPAPTPDDLARGIKWGEVAMLAGVFAAVVGVAIAAWAYVKLNRLRLEAERDAW